MWEWGTPSGTAGPSACYGGTSCIGTVMSGPYTVPMFAIGPDIATSAEVDLTGTVAPQLTYYQWISTGAGDGGYVTVEASGMGEQDITPVPAYNGQVSDMFMTTHPAWVGDLSSQGWHAVTVDLSSFAGTVIRLNFNLSIAQTSTGGPGWYVDDLIVVD